jgi:hypothetical protein
MDKATEEDLEIVKHHIGRTPRGMVGVAHRNEQGEPVVVITAPRIPEPFPTLYYLTHPDVVRAVSKLEASGYMQELSLLLDPEAPEFDEDIAAKYLQAHLGYIADRDELARSLNLEPLTSTHADFSAGGMPSRVKCLHALVGHALAKGEGVNPIGDLALQKIRGPQS